MRLFPWGAISLCCLCGLALVARAEGAEPYREFLDGLRQRQMFDTAQLYLESLKSSELVSAEVKASIPYEQGQIFVDEARTLRDTNLRMKRLADAGVQFEQFLQAQPRHPLVATASLQLGNILLERGRTELELSQRPTQVARKAELVASARENFVRSQQVFDGAAARYVEELQKYPKAIDPQDKAQIAARNTTRLNVLQSRLFSATVLYETSKAYASQSPEWKNLLTAASEQFAAIHKSNEKILAGLFAQMWRGRCLQEMGDSTAALAVYDQLLVQPDSAEFRDLKRKTLRHALECWAGDGQKKYDEAIKQGEGWLKRAQGQEDLTPDGLAIHWLTSAAYAREAEKLDGDAKQKSLRGATEHAAIVAKFAGEFQTAAREVIAKARKQDRGAEPTTFADARARAKREFEAMSVVDGEIKAAQANDREADKVPQWHEERQRLREVARRYYQLALSFRDRETNIETVNECRYFLCYLYYDAGDFFEAAVLGEFLARNYPASSVARPSAKIALASFLQIYNAAPPDDRSFETAHMLAIAEYLGARWPTEAEADEAWMILGDVAIQRQDLAHAAEYLNRVRAESPRRGEADLKAGQALWGAYQNGLRRPVEERLPQVELDRQLADAKGILERGVKRMRDQVAAGGQPTYTLLAAELSLAQLLVDTAQPEQALTLLEQPESGVLALIEAKHPLAKQGPLTAEAYQTALRGYVGAQRLEDAERVMNALEQQSIGSADAAATLTRVYVGLGHELEQQMARLRAEKRTADLARVMSGFEVFLDRIAAREQGNTASSLQWVADTFNRLAAGAETGDLAKKYYLKGSATYERMLALAQRNPEFLGAQAQDGVRIQLARCARGLGEYERALEQLAVVLDSNPNTLEAQVAAAETLQHWGALAPANYQQAISGRPAQRPAVGDIWGWNKLALRLQRYPKHADLYHQARFNVAECSYRFALTQPAKDKIDRLQKAAALIEAMARLDPNMGGEAWRPRYDQLLKTIQQAAGRKPSGLTPLASAGPASSQATAKAAAATADSAH